MSVVRDLDLPVGAGEVVALIGPNGAGKTTTLLTLAGELRPIGGEVLVARRAHHGADARALPQGLSYVTEERSVIMKLTDQGQPAPRGRARSSRDLAVPRARAAR